MPTLEETFATSDEVAKLKLQLEEMTAWAVCFWIADLVARSPTLGYVNAAAYRDLITFCAERYPDLPSRAQGEFTDLAHAVLGVKRPSGNAPGSL